MIRTLRFYVDIGKYSSSSSSSNNTKNGDGSIEVAASMRRLEPSTSSLSAWTIGLAGSALKPEKYNSCV